MLHLFYASQNHSCTGLAFVLNHLPDLACTWPSCTKSRLLIVRLHKTFTAGQSHALGEDSDMTDAFEDDTGNGNSAGEDNDMGDDAVKGKLPNST